MDIGQLITIGSSILTLVTTVLVLLTLFEMRSQRKASYRPEVVLKSDYSFVLYYRSGDISGLNRFFLCDASFDPMHPDWQHYFQVAFLPIEVFNIGLASAKNLHLRWILDFKAFAAFLMAQDQTGQLEIKQDKHFVHISYPQRRLSASYGLSFVGDVDLDFLLPVGASPGSQKVPIPSYYLHGIVALILLLEDNHRSNDLFTELERLPKLYLDASHLDIEDALFRKRYLLKFLFTDVVTVEIPLIEESAQGSEPKAGRICGGTLSISST